MRNFYLKSVDDQREASFRRLSNYITDVMYPYHPYYRKLFKEHGIKPSDIRKPSDLAKIPVTYKDDYRHDPIAFIVHPTPAVYTYRDLHGPVTETASAFWAGKDLTWDIRALNIFPGAPHLAFFQVLMGKWFCAASGFDTFGGNVVPTERQIHLFK